MKKLLTLLFVTTLGVSAFSQTSSIVEKQISIEIKKVHRIEKYGWDNLEVDYKLTNKSKTFIKRVDFKVALINSNNVRIGTVEVHNFHVGQKSKAKFKYIDMSPDYVNAEIHGFELVSKSVKIQGDEQSNNRLANNQSLTNSKTIK